MSKKLLLSERFITDLKNHLQSISSNLISVNHSNYDIGLSDNIDINVNKLQRVIQVINNILKNSTAYEINL
jgi:hypothetical protein